MVKNKIILRNLLISATMSIIIPLQMVMVYKEKGFIQNVILYSIFFLGTTIILNQLEQKDGR